MDTGDKITYYHRLIQNGKDVAKNGDMHKAIEFFKRAHALHYSEKLERRIKKIEELIAENDSEEEDEEFVNVNDSGLMLFKELHNKLYDYQRDGVAFLYSLYRDGRKGGILADDMGLGKTIQVISFLSGMYDNELIKHTMLVMPTSLITNWTKEFAKWTPGMRVKEFHGSSKAERTRNLEKVQRRGGVIITTYTMLMNNWQQLSSYNGKEFTWDYMILDEAHKIKSNTTKTAKSASAVPSKNRVLLTGTPVQNNLKEMWALFDFACQGTLLGTAKTFKTEYENPITRAREKDATPGERALGSRMSENLMAIIHPYFLRRTKAEVRVLNQPEHCGAVMPTLTRKNDLIIWTYLSPIQEDIYRQFISLDHIKELLLTTRSPLAELNILKKLCDHPRLLSARAIATLGLEESTSADAEADSHSIAGVPDETLISESGKLVFLFALIEQLKREGHRTLVFAHYRKVLDIIERILGNKGFKVLRLDGTILQIAERERRISLFQRDSSYSVFLLTTQVGGVGITLTAASRVVIYDPSWNPATDAQAVDRAYRIGQKENVVIYRLITCGTVEEKIYRRQVFKDSLIRQNTGDKKNPFRYFSKQELKELFTLQDTRSSSTQLQLQAMHSMHRRTDPKLDEHIAHLYAMEMFGISDHDLMFSLDVNQDDGPENQEEHHYIAGRVQKAQDLMKAESELQMQLAENMASSTEPAWLRQPLSNNYNNNREPSWSDRTRNLKSSLVSPQRDQGLSGSLEKPVGNVSHDKVSEHSLASPVHQQIKREENYLEDGTVSPQQVADESLIMFEPVDAAVPDVAGVSAIEQTDGSTVSDAAPPLADGNSPAVSSLQASNLSFKADVSSRVSAGLESFEGNFNLELEDSDMFSEADVRDPPETEAVEMELLSKLEIDGSFDVNKSLNERRHREAGAPDLDDSRKSMDTSMLTNKRKRLAVIYDSDDEEEPNVNGGRCDGSFQVLGASTPKSTPAVSTPLMSRRSLAGNTSVASWRSLAHSIIEDVDNRSADNDEAKADDENGYSSEILSYKAEEEEGVNSHSAPESEEPEGETLNTEGEEEEDEEEMLEEEEVLEEEEEMLEEEEDENLSDSDPASRSEENTNLDESMSEPELASNESVDKCTARDEVCPMNGKNAVEVETYDLLVSKGKECVHQGRKDDALNFFLKAIDIKPGDPEIQLLTIQLYRQLSQRS
uniref:DNA excision repair protein ERCC-6-like n=1 Tax=Cynoglossus semilaevis TaxID=244447 RepID=A0A3P8VUA2_CYNSE